MTIYEKETQALVGCPLCPTQLQNIHLSFNQPTSKPMEEKPDEKLGYKSCFVAQVVVCGNCPWSSTWVDLELPQL